MAGKAQVASAQAQVTASEIALNGVREEAKAGQRTTLDVLNAQQALVNARIALRYRAARSRGRILFGADLDWADLSPQVLNLATTTYDASVHYQQVRDSWAGVRIARWPGVASSERRPARYSAGAGARQWSRRARLQSIIALTYRALGSRAICAAFFVFGRDAWLCVGGIGAARCIGRA